MSSDELLDIIFRRGEKEAKKAFKVRGESYQRKRKSEIARVTGTTEALVGTMSKVIKRMPVFDRLSPFYLELMDLLVDLDELKKALGSMSWMINKTVEMETHYTYKIRTARKEAEMTKYRKAFYGRLASHLRKIDPNMDFLRDAREKLKNLPGVEDTFTAVIAGAPNVGKSTLLRALTGAEPQVASYPFTTKDILLGHFEERYRRYQVVDTPGLLDRPIAERNPVEQKAVLALKHLANVIFFVFDPTEGCGFGVEDQMNIYRDIKENFDLEVVPVVNKADLLDEGDIGDFKKVLGEDVMVCSAMEGEGIEEIKEMIITAGRALKSPLELRE